MVGPIVVGNVLGQVGSIIFFIVVFSALASSLDSLLAATSDLITQDIYRGHINKEANDERCYGNESLHYCHARSSDIVIVSSQNNNISFFTLFYRCICCQYDLANCIWSLFSLGIWNCSSSCHDFRYCYGFNSLFQIGFYVAALVSATISLFVVLLFGKFSPDNFSFLKFNARKIT